MGCSTWDACHGQAGAHLHANGKTFAADLTSHRCSQQLHVGVEAGRAPAEAIA